MRQGRPVRFLACELMARSGLWPRWSERLSFDRLGYRLKLFPAAVCRATWSNPGLVFEEQKFFRRYLRGGDTVIDAGANVGDTAIFASTIVGPAGSVHAFEAHPRTFSFLREHVRMNKVSNVTLYNLALGASTEDLRFSDLRTDDGNHVVSDGIRVRQARLDDLLRSVGNVDLFKVDVEGYELFVFRGAADVLRRTECIFFESWETHFAKFGYCGRDVLSLLRESGFNLLRERAGAWWPIETEYRSEDCQNLVAVRDLARFRERYGRESFSAATAT